MPSSSSSSSTTTTRSPRNPLPSSSTPPSSPPTAALIHRIPNATQQASQPGALADSILLSTTLTILHLTLTILVHNQYAQRLDVGAVLRSEAVLGAFPLLLCIIYPVHWVRARSPGGRQLLLLLLVEAGLFAMAVLAGSRLVGLVNDGAYLAVMKRAPALGTVWVWTVVEMGLGPAVGSLGIVAVWAWGRGYTF